MGYYCLTLVLFLLTAHMAAGVPADCGQTYQNTLKSLLTQKENCDTARFKDCCQVQTLKNSASKVNRQIRLAGDDVSTNLIGPCDLTGISSIIKQHAIRCKH